MDYGVMVKKTVHPDPNHRSVHYKKQPKFKGSNRELRGKVLRLKIATPDITIDKLSEKLNQPEAKVREIVTKMEDEGFFRNSDQKTSQ
jgi:A/G-specific adenine glycosylase